MTTASPRVIQKAMRSHAAIAMAVTLEAPRTLSKRRRDKRHSNRPWHPWREVGVVVGIVLVAVVFALTHL